MRNIRIALLLLALGLSACGGAAAPATPAATTGLENEPVATTGLEATSGLAATTEPAATTDPATQTSPTSAAEPTTMTEASPAATTEGDAMTTTTPESGTVVAETPASGTTVAETPAAGMEQDIVTLAGNDPRFSILVTALKGSGLDQTLAGVGPYTVFAPTDDAFAKLPAGTFAAIQQNPELLRSILTYHVVQGRVLAADITGETTVQSLDGDPITITSENGTLMLNNSAAAMETMIEGSNGMVYAIDNVLLPPDIQLPSVQ